VVRIRPKQYPSGTVKKLHGPFKILRRINSNAYIVDLSPDFGISPSVNIEDLVACKGPIFSPDKPLLNKPSPEPTFERSSSPYFRKKNPTTKQNKLMKLLMIRLSLLELVITKSF